MEVKSKITSVHPTRSHMCDQLLPKIAALIVRTHVRDFVVVLEDKRKSVTRFVGSHVRDLFMKTRKKLSSCCAMTKALLIEQRRV